MKDLKKNADVNKENVDISLSEVESTDEKAMLLYLNKNTFQENEGWLK